MSRLIRKLKVGDNMTVRSGFEQIDIRVRELSLRTVEVSIDAPAIFEVKTSSDGSGYSQEDPLDTHRKCKGQNFPAPKDVLALCQILERNTSGTLAVTIKAAISYADARQRARDSLSSLGLRHISISLFQTQEDSAPHEKAS